VPTNKFPTLGVGNLLFDKHIPSTVARTVNVIATSAKGAAGGVAPLDASQHLPVENVVTGAVLAVNWNGIAWPATRPTGRTDVKVFVAGPAGTAGPVWMLATDDYSTY
jgi:hypothetical protein